MEPSKVVVRMKDGTVVRGQTNDFFPNKPQFHLTTAEGFIDEYHLEEMKAELEIQKDPTTNHVEFCHSDVRFHRIIVDATDNPLVRMIMDPVLDALQPIFNMAIYRYRDRDRIFSQHKQIYDALKNQAADKAIKTMIEQLDDLHELSTSARFIAQIIATTIMAVVGGVVLNDFGYLFAYRLEVPEGARKLSLPYAPFVRIAAISVAISRNIFLISYLNPVNQFLLPKLVLCISLF